MSGRIVVGLEFGDELVKVAKTASDEKAVAVARVLRGTMRYHGGDLRKGRQDLEAAINQLPRKLISVAGETGKSKSG